MDEGPCKSGAKGRGWFLIGLLSYLTNGQVFEKYRGATFGGVEGFVKIKVGHSLDKRTPGRKMISMPIAIKTFGKTYMGRGRTGLLASGTYNEHLGVAGLLSLGQQEVKDEETGEEYFVTEAHQETNDNVLLHTIQKGAGTVPLAG